MREAPRRVKVEGDLFHGRVPEGAVYVGRAAPGLARSRFANPFKPGDVLPDYFDGAVDFVRNGKVEDRQHAAEAYWFWIRAKVPFTAADVRAELAGRDLACWCPPDEVCHADQLLAIANTP